MYNNIDVYENMNLILKQLKRGITITPTTGDKVNPMTISWGHIGVEWNTLSFITYVRGSRHTFGMLEEAESFTVNIPLADEGREIIKFCGSNSGRDFDKAKHLELTTVKTRKIDGFGFKELPLTLECKVIYKQFQDKTQIPEHLRERFYPEGYDDHDNYHTMFYGEIVDAYILK